MQVPETVRAVRMHETGGPEVLRLEEVPVPRPGSRQALVKVEAAGLDFIETYQRSGQYPVGLPATKGSEGAGVVVSLGDGADDIVAEGDRVAWAMGTGAYAEYVVIDATRLSLPDTPLAGPLHRRPGRAARRTRAGRPADHRQGAHH